MKTILVPLDDSALAERSLAPAADLARATGAALVLVQGVPFFTSPYAREREERANVAEAIDYLQGVQQRLAAEGLAATIEPLPGTPVQAILFAALRHRADLIALSTHGAGLQAAIMGSVASAVLQHSECPVLVVRGSIAAAPVSTPVHQHILVPLDGTPLSESALAYLVGEGIARQATVTLFRAVAPISLPPVASLAGGVDGAFYEYADQEQQRQRQQAQEYLQSVGERYLHELAWQTELACGFPAEEIVACATRQGASLIVMATAGRHGFDRLVHGSVAGQVLRHATVPMLLVHEIKQG